jgi:uroporphyrinogen III methyltransferase / synthase
MSGTPVLAGRRIVVTRRREQAGVLTAALVELGAEVLEVPLLEVVPPADEEPLRRALAELESYGWLVVTSANAVEAFAGALGRAGRSLPPHLRLASVGPATSAAVRLQLGAEPSLEPASDFRAEGLLRAFEPVDFTGDRVLLPVSDRARSVLAEGLGARGARVDVVVAYQTVTPPGAREALGRALGVGADLVALASPSAVEGLVAALGEAAAEVAVGVIGPVTEHAARAAGLSVRVVASPATARGLVDAIRGHFQAAR